MKFLWCEKCARRLQVIAEGGRGTYTCPCCLGKVEVPDGQKGNQPTLTELTAKVPVRSADQPACPGCGASVQADWRLCPICKALLRVDYSKEEGNKLTRQGLDQQVSGDRKKVFIALWVLAALCVFFMVKDAFSSVSKPSAGGNLFPTIPMTNVVGGLVFLALFGVGLLKMEKSNQRGLAMVGGVFLFFVLAFCSGVIVFLGTCVLVTTRVL